MLKSKLSVFALLALIGMLLLSACGQTAVSSETTTGDYVAEALTTYDVGSSLGAGIGFAALALVLGLVAGAVTVTFLGETKKGTHNWPAAIGAFALVAVLTLGIPSIKASYIVIQPGYAGVVVQQGKALDTPLLEGPHSIVPFYQSVRIYSIRPFAYSLVANGNKGETPDMKGGEQFRSYYQGFETSDGVKGMMPYIVQASLNPQTVVNFYRNYGTLEYGVVQLIKTPAISLVRDVLRGMTATQVVTTIDQKNAAVQAELTKIAEAGGLTIIDFSFSKPDMGTWGDERDLTATTAQQALTEAKKVEIAKATADANIATQAGVNTVNLNAAVNQAAIDKTKAEGEANAAKIEADAEAYTTLTTAAAQAEANQQLALSLSEMLLKYQWILKWDGAQPRYMGGNSDTLLNIPME